MASVLMGFRPGVSPVQPGVDGSYAFALNYAAVHGERWGTELLADRGPYGWLLYPVDVGDIAPSWLLIEALFVVAVGVVVAAYAWSVPGPFFTRAWMALVLTYTVHLASTEDWRWFAMFLLVFLLGVHVKGRAGLIAMSLASVLSGFGLLMKLTLGPGAILALVVGCFLPRISWSGLARLALVGGGAVVGLLAGWVGHYGSTTGLVTYLAVGFSMIKGYSYAASAAFEGSQVVVAGFLAFFLLVVAWAVMLRHARAGLSLACCAAPLFVAFKYSVVRQDVHGRVLVLFGFAVVAVLITDSLTAERKWRAAPLLAGAVGSLITAWFYLPPIEGAPGFAATVSQPLRLPGIGGLGSILRFQAYRAHLAQLSQRALEPFVLPADELEAIGNSTVDVYPWEASYVAANHLQWAHRPSTVSSASVDPMLDRANAAFFDSERRPQRLLWHKTSQYFLRTPGVSGVASIDGRHLFWDEPLTLVSILNHYQLISAGRVFVLGPRKDARFGSREWIQTVTVPWGVWTEVPDVPGVVLAEINLPRPWWTKIVPLLLREPEMSADVRFRAREKPEGRWTAQEIHCRFFPNLTTNGLWISPLPHNRANLEAVLAGELPEGAKVGEIRFSNQWSVSAPDLRVHWFRLKSASPRESKDGRL